MANDELIDIYQSGNSGAILREDILYHRRYRADAAAKARKKARVRRMKGQDISCTIDWLNETFDANLDSLPKGFPGENASCPVALAISEVISTQYICVDGISITYMADDSDDVKTIRVPFCVESFISNFDRGNYPQLIHPDFNVV